MLKKGALLRRNGRFKEALEWLDKALKAQPGRALIWMNKGMVLEAMGRMDEARDCFRMAQRISADARKGTDHR